MQEPVLLADIGATNARFALLRHGTLGQVSAYQVTAYPTPEDAARAFLDDTLAGTPPPRSAVIAAAGAPVDGKISMVNAGWTLDPALLAPALGLSTVRVLNDFEALAWALPDLGPDDLVALDDVPRPSTGTLAVIGPGTGFGLAALVRGTADDRPVVTEGGHATLAAEDAREDAVIDCLRAEFGHVSVERVLSGAGLAALYRALAKVENRPAPERDSPAIVAHALDGDCPHSRETLAMFCAFLGSVAGNTALTLGATGGVFIAGGVTPRFRSFLVTSAFRERFEAKGRLQPYLARIPARLIVHPNPAFVGLCRLARQSDG